MRAKLIAEAWGREAKTMKSGIAILSIMAAIWAVVALHAAKCAAMCAYSGAVIVAFIPFFLMAPRLSQNRTKEDGRRIGRVVGLATLFEAVAIFAGVKFVVAAGRPDLAVCVVAGVVGIHFFPLARWMPLPVRRYYLTGPALLFAACAGVVLPGEYRDVFVAGAASAILWATALSLVSSLPQSAPQAG